MSLESVQLDLLRKLCFCCVPGRSLEGAGRRRPRAGRAPQETRPCRTGRRFSSPHPSASPEKEGITGKEYSGREEEEGGPQIHRKVMMHDAPARIERNQNIIGTSGRHDTAEGGFLYTEEDTRTEKKPLREFLPSPTSTSTTSPLRNNSHYCCLSTFCHFFHRTPHLTIGHQNHHTKKTHPQHAHHTHAMKGLPYSNCRIDFRAGRYGLPSYNDHRSKQNAHAHTHTQQQPPPPPPSQQ